jgi:hypothetical protein
MYNIILSRVGSGYRRLLGWWPDLLDSLTQRVTTLYSTLLHTNVYSHVFIAVAW